MLLLICEAVQSWAAEDGQTVNMGLYAMQVVCKCFSSSSFCLFKYLFFHPLFLFRVLYACRIQREYFKQQEAAGLIKPVAPPAPQHHGSLLETVPRPEHLKTLQDVSEALTGHCAAGTTSSRDSCQRLGGLE